MIREQIKQLERYGNDIGYSPKIRKIFIQAADTIKVLYETKMYPEKPCEVGDTVYKINKIRDGVSEFKVKAIRISASGTYIEWDLIDGVSDNLSEFNADEIGKTVFFTAKEAKNALKGLTGGEQAITEQSGTSDIDRILEQLEKEILKNQERLIHTFDEEVQVRYRCELRGICKAVKIIKTELKK